MEEWSWVVVLEAAVNERNVRLQMSSVELWVCQKGKEVPVATVIKCRYYHEIDGSSASFETLEVIYTTQLTLATKINTTKECTDSLLT